MEPAQRAGAQAWNKITQVGLVVKDLDRAIAGLSALGVGPLDARDYHLNERYSYRGKPMNTDIRLASTDVGGVGLELVQPVRGDSAYQEFLDNKGEGIQHIMVAVDDFAKEFDKLTRQGATPLLYYKGNYRETAYLDIHIGGLIIELSKRAPAPS